MDVELQATCSALGYLEGNEYVKEPDCLETVKDLIRFLRRDTDVCDIRRQLGNAQILQNDLVPIVKAYDGDKDLFDTVIKLLVNLTQPVISCFNNEIPDEKTLRNNCLEVEGYLQDYKEAFIDEELFSVLATKIQNILKMEWDERREEDKLQLERLFMLVRNVLLVPADADREQRTEDDASTHDQVLWAMHTSGLEDLILYVASSDRERSHLCMHVMEIIALIFKEQEPETLASAGVHRSLTEKEKDQRELEQAREREKAQKKANILKFSGRHSRFGGTFVLKNIKSISENDVIYHKPLCEVKRFSYDEGKNRKKISKNRAPIKTDDPKRRSTLSMRLSLKEFCIQFLINAYNPLMRAVKDALTRKSAQDNDETFYLWAMRFFMEFCRLHCKRVDFISETMSMSALHYIYTQLCTYYESVRLGKGEECKVWGRRSHLALKAYQELLRTLDFMSRSEDEQIRESAKVIQSNVFYMMEYRDVFVTLLKNFKESQCSRAYLRDLVESTHIFLKMLETFTKRNKNLVVQKKKKKKGKKKKKTASAEPMAEPTEEELETIWGESISDQVSACLQGREEVPANVAPFDAASEMDMDQQRVEAMLRIQSSLRDGRSGEAIALFRAAREVWPEGEEFGSAEMGEEEEFMALREIFMAALPRPQQSQVDAGDEEQEEDNEMDEDEMGGMEASESTFDFNGFINDFAHINVLKSYSILLREFSENSDAVNHCVVKMLHRLSHDLGYVGMLFQASVFKSFNSLINGPYARLPRFKELAKFATFVVRQFTNVAKINKKIFVDMLFWKSKSEALAVTSGYDFSAKSKAKTLWTEHQEDELLGLYEKFRDVTHPEMDTADLILGELTSNHTRIQVIRELKRQGLINSAADLKRKGRGRGWTEQEVQELRDAFELHKDSNFPISDIMTTLTSGRGRQAVTTKILELGLVADKGELKKKRKGGGSRKRRGGSEDEEDSEGERLFPDTTGGRRQKSKHSDESSEESSDDEGDDDDESDVGDGGNDNADDAVRHLVSQAACSVGDYVSKLVEQGYQEQIEWIARNLRNAAEDREEGVCIPTPIVPLTEESETAMEDESFLIFLRAIGITSPANQQELFWRIPAQFSPADLTAMADGLEVTGSGQASDPDQVQRIVTRTFPGLLTASPAQGGKVGSGEDKGRKKKEKRKKKLKKQKEKDTKKRREKSAKDVKRRSHTKNRQLAEEDNPSSQEETENGPFVPVIARIAHGSDTSDSGLDSDLEAQEQQRMWQEKKSGKAKGMSAADRKEALQRMMARRNQKRKRKAPGGGETGTTDGTEASGSDIRDKTAGRGEKDDGLSAQDGEAADAADGDTTTSGASPSRSGGGSASKKRRVQQIESDSDSDTSSLSSLSEAPEGGEEEEEREERKDESPLKSSLNSSATKKRMLDSDSDSDVPLAKDKRKRQKNNSDDEDLDLSLDNQSISKGADKSESSDKENKDTDSQSQSQLDESLRLHFSTSDEDDDEDDNNNGEKVDSKEVQKENGKEETQMESFPATLLTQGFDSEDEEDDHITLKTAVKRRRAAVIDSDEDE